MNNIQFIFAVSMPTLAVLVGILVNQVQTSGISREVSGLRSDVQMLTGKVIELIDRVAKLEGRGETH
jgi:uncharacterized protein YoxC